MSAAYRYTSPTAYNYAADAHNSGHNVGPNSHSYFMPPDAWSMPAGSSSSTAYGYSSPFSTTTVDIMDDEGYSDDDGILTSETSNTALNGHDPELPVTLKYHRVATTGMFTEKINHRITVEISKRGGVAVDSVNASTTVLLVPHLLARSRKARMARQLGIPIIDEEYFLKLPLEENRYGW